MGVTYAHTHIYTLLLLDFKSNVILQNHLYFMYMYVWTYDLCIYLKLMMMNSIKMKMILFIQDLEQYKHSTYVPKVK